MTLTELKAKVFDLIVEREHVINSATNRAKEIDTEIITTQELINKILIGE